MKKTVSKLLSLILVFSMLASLALTSAMAGPISRLLITLPEETYGTDPEVQVDLYEGIPVSSSSDIATLVGNGILTLVKEDIGDREIVIPEAGNYCYYVSGEGYYTILKLFIITDEDVANGKTIAAEGGRIAGDGFEPTYKPELAPDTYVMDKRDMTLTNWTDEVLEHFKVQPQGYQTPAFDGSHAANEFTSQDELMAFVKDRTDNCDYMYLYSAGTTPNYGYDLPMVLITKEDISGCATLEEAADVMAAGGKVNIWYQSQIHPNEPASGEASLVMIDNFINDATYQSWLGNVNIIMVPRINPDGSYLFSRATYGGFDMNRDHTALKAKELADLHTAWRLFKTEVVIDTHEFTYYGYDTKNGRMNNADDIQTTPASSLNNDPDLNALALDMAAAAFAAEQDSQYEVGADCDPIRVNHYGSGNGGWTANPPIGRCYFGLLECLSFLIETRGIGAGRNNFERRVLSQEIAATAYIQYTAEHATTIKSKVADARAKLIENGKTYDENDLFALHQTASGATLTPYTTDKITYKLDGTEVLVQKDLAMPMNDTMARSRPRPTAYVIPADHENIEQILYIMDNQGAEYYKIGNGKTMWLQQYYYAGTYTKGFKADLRSETAVTFAKGAYVFPMDQLAANVIASICEPDMNDSNGYDGSLVQYGLISYDSKTMNYPIYRYIHDNPSKKTNALAKTMISFEFPVENYGSATPDVKVDFLRNYPTSTSVSASWVEQNMLFEDVGTSGCFMPVTPGFYSYYVTGDGYYKLLKVLYFSEDDIEQIKKDGGLTITVEGGKATGAGYEPTVTPSDAPASYKQDPRDATLINWPDQVLENAFSVEPQGYKTPAFTWPHAAHELTSQEKMEQYVQQRVSESSYMYLYSAGKSAVYKMNLPLVIISTTPIPAGATLEEAAAIIKADGKTNVWYQSQIHPNEPASGEASLVMLDNFNDDETYYDMLEDINVILIPRVNPEGSYLYSRATYGGFDMNRDHTSLKAVELAQLHTAWRLFETEVVVDTHEYNWYGARNDTTYGDIVYDADDIETTPATSLNHDSELTDIALEMAGKVFEAERAAGLRVDHYQGTGYTVNPPIGRCYFGLLDCLSFLIETRGIGGGMNGFERRVRSQEVAVTGYLQYTADNAKMIKDKVAAARAKLIENGKTYDEDDIFALYQVASGNKVTPYLSTSYAVDMKTGENIATKENWALALNDTIVRGRPRPTAYVIPADHPYMQDILYIMDNQGAEYYTIDAGSCANLQQYYYVDTFKYNNRNVGFKADLRDETTVTFANGAYVFPMDQLAANVIASICEPDVNDSNGYDGSLAQYKKDGVNALMSYDAATKNYPLYRYCHDDPRGTLVSNSALNGLTLSVAAVKPESANTVKVNVKVNALKALGAVVLHLDYDSKMTLVDVQGASNWQLGDKNLVINQDIAAGKSATLALTFYVASGVQLDPTVTAQVVTACDKNGTEMFATFYTAGVIYVAGDVTGDGKILSGDLLRLRDYIGMNGEGVTVSGGADINFDGKIDGLDLTALNRYFATASF